MAKPPPINLEEVMAAAMKALKANRSNVGKVVDDVAGAGKGLVETITKAVKGGSKPPKPKMPKNPPKSVVRQAMPEDVRFPKNPPKSGAAASEKPLTPAEYALAKADNASLAKTGKELVKEEKLMGTGGMDANDLAILKLYKSGAFTTKSKLPKNPPKSGGGKNPPAAGAVVPAPKSPKPKSPKSGTADAAEREAAKEAKSLENKAAWAVKREEYNAVKRTEREARKAANRANWQQKLDEKYGGNIAEAAKATSKSPSKANRNKKKGTK